MLGFLGAIIIGFIVGLIARALMPGKDQIGFILTTLLGIAGAMVGKYLGEAAGWYRGDEPAGFGMSLLGAMLILFIYNMFKNRNTSSS